MLNETWMTETHKDLDIPKPESRRHSRSSRGRRRTTLLLTVLLAGIVPEVVAQAVEHVPVYEVSTIKPSRPEERARGIGPDGRRFIANYTTISQVMQYAYNLQEKQIVNAPAWFDHETFDLVVIADGGEPSVPQWRVILRQMLVERFKIDFHHEERTMVAYLLTVAKSGPKLEGSNSQPGTQNGVHILRGPHQWMKAIGVHATMTELAAELQRVEMDRPVVDQTGLSGVFDFTLIATSTKPFFEGEEPAQGEDAPPVLFTALEEQLGLRLVPGKAPVDCFVIDHVERPMAD